MKQEETNRNSEEDHTDKYANADYLTIKNIKLNYERMEQGIVNELYFKVPHGSTIGHYREQIWEKMFRNIVPKKFVIEQSMFIIDSCGQVSKEVDLAIFDETYTPYIFSYGNLKFLPIEAVAAVIECKSSSMNKKILRAWASSIKALKTSNKSYTRTLNKIACGEIEHSITQSATRPLRILCCLNEKEIGELVNEDEKPFDIVIRAVPDKGGKLQIEWDDRKKNLYDWYVSLNHAKGLPEHKNDQAYWEEAVKNYGLDKYLVHHEGTALSLLTFNF